MKESHVYDLIERHLLGKATPKERLQLEKEMAEDPQLAEMFARQKQEHDAMEVFVEERLRNQLQRWAQEHPLREPSVWRLKTIMLIAASALLLLAVYLFWPSDEHLQDHRVQKMEPEQPPIEQSVPASQEGPVAALPPATKQAIPSEEEKKQRILALASRYNKTSGFKREILRDGEESPNLLGEALTALENKKYARALDLLGQVSEDHPNYVFAQHLIGQALFVQRKYAKALPYLKKVASVPDYYYKSDAEWELALTHLHLLQVSAAKQLLRQMQRDTGHPWQDKAHMLLAEIER